MVKVTPILFRGAMVNSILKGDKTQTRRIIKPQPEMSASGGYSWNGKKGSFRGMMVSHSETFPDHVKDYCPFGSVNDLLWVRETFMLAHNANEAKLRKPYLYRADGESIQKWKPSIFMPREASRITLRINKIGAERLQEISHQDALNEGVTSVGKLYCMDWSQLGDPIKGLKTIDGKQAIKSSQYIANDNPKGAFATYFEQINGSDAWDRNPWVWVIDFTPIFMNINEYLEKRVNPHG